MKMTTKMLLLLLVSTCAAAPFSILDNTASKDNVKEVSPGLHIHEDKKIDKKVDEDYQFELDVHDDKKVDNIVTEDHPVGLHVHEDAEVDDTMPTMEQAHEGDNQINETEVLERQNRRSSSWELVKSDDCWWSCGWSGGKCSWCGIGGYCCRKGYDDCPEGAGDLSRGKHRCVRLRSDCYISDSQYSPIDDIPGQGRTQEESASACQKRCLGISGCSYFSFWDDGGCHLSSSGATLKSKIGVTAGPCSCSGSCAVPTHWKSFAYTLMCNHPGSNSDKANQVLDELNSNYPGNNWVVAISDKQESTYRHIGGISNIWRDTCGKKMWVWTKPNTTFKKKSCTSKEQKRVESILQLAEKTGTSSENIYERIKSELAMFEIPYNLIIVMRKSNYSVRPRIYLSCYIEHFGDKYDIIVYRA